MESWDAHPVDVDTKNGVISAHSETMETHNGGLETHPGDIEDRPAVLGPQIRSMEKYLGRCTVTEPSLLYVDSI